MKSTNTGGGGMNCFLQSSYIAYTGTDAKFPVSPRQYSTVSSGFPAGTALLVVQEFNLVSDSEYIVQLPVKTTLLTNWE